MRIQITPEALAQIAKLPVSIRLRIRSVTDRLAEWPQVSGAKWLTADWKGHARIRTGDYRVIFRAATMENDQGEEEEVILVVRIAHRKDVYAE